MMLFHNCQHFFPATTGLSWFCIFLRDPASEKLCNLRLTLQSWTLSRDIYLSVFLQTDAAKTIGK